MRPINGLLALALVLGGCDSGGDAKQAQAAKAKADKDKAAQEQTDANIAKRKAAREAEETAKVEADDKRKTEFDRLCALPDPMPKKSPSCDDVGEAHDAFLRRVGDAELIKKWDGGGKESELPMTIVRCAQADSNKVSLCQKHALDGAGADMLGHEKELLQKCIEKFGKAARGGRSGVVPPKPGG